MCEKFDIRNEIRNRLLISQQRNSSAPNYCIFFFPFHFILVRVHYIQQSTVNIFPFVICRFMGFMLDKWCHFVDWKFFSSCHFISFFFSCWNYFKRKKIRTKFQKRKQLVDLLTVVIDDSLEKLCRPFPVNNHLSSFKFV